jgi:hypothetical protein
VWLVHQLQVSDTGYLLIFLKHFFVYRYEVHHGERISDAAWTRCLSRTARLQVPCSSKQRCCLAGVYALLMSADVPASLSLLLQV